MTSYRFPLTTPRPPSGPSGHSGHSNHPGHAPNTTRIATSLVAAILTLALHLAPATPTAAAAAAATVTTTNTPLPPSSSPTPVSPTLRAATESHPAEQRQPTPPAVQLDPAHLALHTAAQARSLPLGPHLPAAHTLGIDTRIDPNALEGPNPASSPIAQPLFQSPPRIASLTPGTLDTRTPLDFFLLANAAALAQPPQSPVGAPNSDALSRVAAHAHGLADSPLFFLALESLYGTPNENFDDLLFALDFSHLNVAALTATPEPSTYALLACLVALAIAAKRRRDARTASNPPPDAAA